jgi:hypothetical protein
MRRGSKARGSAPGLLLALALAVLPRLAAAQACQLAAAAAERAYALPAGLLGAIGVVESGHDGNPGWPWTINAQGEGRFFADRAAAVAAAQEMQQQGRQSLDIGCFQVNLLYHPDAFASLRDAFDPDRNAIAAARFLAALYQQSGNWSAAIMRYHSATPAAALPYLQRVQAAWRQGGSQQGVAALARGEAPTPLPRVVAGVAVWAPSPAGTAPAVIVLTPGRWRLPVVLGPAP